MILLVVGVGAVALVAVVTLTRSRDGAGPTLTVPGVQPPVPDDAVALLRAGKKLEAIKRYRQVTGIGLKQAKDVIDALASGPAPPDVHPEAGAAVSPGSADSDIEREIRARNLIGAIKLYRERHRTGLKEAKDAVEAWRDRLGAG